jgi:hypothetical protein
LPLGSGDSDEAGCAIKMTLWHKHSYKKKTIRKQQGNSQDKQLPLPSQWRESAFAR